MTGRRARMANRMLTPVPTSRRVFDVTGFIARIVTVVASIVAAQMSRITRVLMCLAPYDTLLPSVSPHIRITPNPVAQ